jgi:hypothetical protein
MHFFLLLILLLTPAYTADSGDTAPMNALPTLFEFHSTDEPAWQVVNDGVMGGRSRGYVAIEDGTLRFTGTLVTRGGGFTSIRAERGIDLEGYTGLELRVRGGGRTFEVEVSDGARFRGRPVSRRAPFPTSAEWTRVRVPFDTLRTTFRGRPVTVAPLDPAKIERIGLFMADGRDGPFHLEVDSIRAYRADE